MMERNFWMAHSFHDHPHKMRSSAGSAGVPMAARYVPVALRADPAGGAVDVDVHKYGTTRAAGVM